MQGVQQRFFLMKEKKKIKLKTKFFYILSEQNILKDISNNLHMQWNLS